MSAPQTTNEKAGIACLAILLLMALSAGGFALGLLVGWLAWG